MKASLNPNLREFWMTRTLPDGHRVSGRTLYGGRESSKSHDAAGMLIARANFCKQNALCTRMFQNKIADSVYQVLCNKIYDFNLQHRFRIYKDAIENPHTDSVFHFYGISRNIDEIKSYEGADIWWNEESQNLNENMYKIIRPTVMRNKGAEMWFTLNPGVYTDFSYQKLVVNPPAGFLTRLINYDENPFLTSDALQDIMDAKAEDPDDFDHIYLGIPLMDDQQSIIKRSWLEAATDADIKLGLTEQMSGQYCTGFDVADGGDDRNSTTTFNGCIAVGADVWKAGEEELDLSAQRAWSHTAGGILLYDCIGVGAGVGPILKLQGHHGYYKFDVRGEVKNPDHQYVRGITNKRKFENLKAQSWYDVARRLANTYNAVMRGKEYDPQDLISIRSTIPNLEKIKGELCEPHKFLSKKGLDMVEPKEKVKDRLKKSHDLADSFIMGACPHLSNRTSSVMDVDSIDDDALAEAMDMMEYYG